tara:strand:- start:109 stop:618 length:510 start_codon:yes stop_codon:yes gene_type:complete
MDIDRIITIIKDLREEVPTNNTGSNSSTAGFSIRSDAKGPVAGKTPNLFSNKDSLLDQDYQTPYGLNYRFSNVFPAAKLNETDIDDMVDASKEYMNLSDKSNTDSRLEKLIDIVRSIREEAIAAVPTNNASSGAIAGLPPDTPPVKKKKKYIYGGHGSRKMWLANKKNG